MVERGLCRPGHAGPGLTVLIGTGERLDNPCRVVWAEQEHVDMRSVVCQVRGNVRMDTGDVVKPAITTCRADLIRDDRRRDPRRIEFWDRVGRSVDELHPVNRTPT